MATAAAVPSIRTDGPFPAGYGPSWKRETAPGAGSVLRSVGPLTGGRSELDGRSAGRSTGDGFNRIDPTAAASTHAILNPSAVFAGAECTQRAVICSVTCRRGCHVDAVWAEPGCERRLRSTNRER